VLGRVSTTSPSIWIASSLAKRASYFRETARIVTQPGSPRN